MADTKTTHLELIKQDPDTKPDYEKDDSNLDKLDEEIWKRGKEFNGTPVDEYGNFVVRSIPEAENITTSSSQKSTDDFISRSSGGEASIADKGDAWLIELKGHYTHAGYVPQSVQMVVTPMGRYPDPAITATLDEETFEAYVGEAGTYTVSYDGENWDTSPTLYGLTISNTPIAGDIITMTWDGENDAVVTVNAATRPTPATITATIDEETFISYVTSASGTVTLTYGVAWSADPADYGITVTGDPVAGDVITVTYVKEVRGLITQSNPQSFVSTGWNLYNHALGYARVLKYSNEQGYGFKVAGTYTALEFATTTTGSRTTITPVSGYFAIPSDGYVFVTGGNATDTEIWMTWSDWGTEPNNGNGFEVYEEYVIDLSGYMAYRFPDGLMAVGAVQDSININTGVATSRVMRLAYNATNLANAKASGREYEYDENYIYLERETPLVYDTSWEDSTGGTTVTRTLDGAYTSNDHGIEYFTGTAVQVYAETIYGANLKNKLERDVLTISQQTLTATQKAQVRTNLGVPSQSEVDALNSSKISISAIANNLTTDTEGYVLDARQGKALSEHIGKLYSKSCLNRLTYSSKVTHVDGDVVTVLNEDLAIIQLRLEISESMNGGETIVDNLPPAYGANNTVIPTNNKNIGLYLTNYYGQNKAALKISGSTSGALSSGTLIVNAAYIISI